MKKVLFICLLATSVFACTESNIKEINKDSEVPVYVQEFKADSTVECFYKVDSECYIYLISSQTSKVAEKITKDNNSGGLFSLGLFCGMFFTILICVIFGAFD